MSSQSLEALLQTAGNPVNMLRNSQIGAYVYPVVPAEYTNWRDEQRAWRETCVLFDQSHHMVEQYVEGPDALKLFSHLAINSFAKFPVDKAKQFVPCNYDGYVIGDGILFHLAENKLVFVGRAPSASWIQFHAETGGSNLTTSKDDRSPSVTPTGRLHWRKDEVLPGMAARGELRRYRFHRRKLLFQEHRRLLHDAVRAGLRSFRQVRSRLHRP